MNLYWGTLLLIPASVFVTLQTLHPLAQRVGYVDAPSSRKQHDRDVPLVGGWAVIVGIGLVWAMLGLWAVPSWQCYMAIALCLALLGVLDDLVDLTSRLRLALQAAVVGVALGIGLCELLIYELGDLLGSGALLLTPVGAAVFTTLCVLGAINAFNMIDGIDGLCGTLTALILAVLSGLFLLHGHEALGIAALLLVVVVSVFLMANLELGPFRGRKVFLGDAGAMVLGFTVAWLLILGSQGEDRAFRPITGVWLLGLPGVDMLSLFFRRLRSGRSPISADRGHIHHILTDAGLSHRRALVSIASLHGAMMGWGVVGEWLAIPGTVMMLTWVVFLACYIALANERVLLRFGT